MINGKIYIGKHKTNNINDDYLGSGKLFNYSIEKYGVENFKKEILFIFDTEQEMNDKEKELVTVEFISHETNYNIKEGGQGGFDYINKTGKNGADKAVRKRKELMNNKEWLDEFENKRKSGLRKYNQTLTAEERSRRGKKANQTALENNGKYSFQDRTHSDAAKSKIGEKNSIHQIGSSNSHYGKIWVYNLDLKESKSIYPEVLTDYISRGWVKGRKIKFD